MHDYSWRCIFKSSLWNLSLTEDTYMLFLDTSSHMESVQVKCRIQEKSKGTRLCRPKVCLFFVGWSKQEKSKTLQGHPSSFLFCIVGPQPSLHVPQQTYQTVCIFFYYLPVWTHKILLLNYGKSKPWSSQPLARLTMVLWTFPLIYCCSSDEWNHMYTCMLAALGRKETLR